MVRVVFLQDFRGKITKEIFYQAGAIVEFESATAQQLLDEKRVKLARVEAEEKQPEEPKRKAKKGTL